MKSVRLQLLVTVLALAVAVLIFILRGPPPRMDWYDAVLEDLYNGRAVRVANMTQHIAWGTDVNTEIAGSWTALHYAVAVSSDEEGAMGATFLICHGANVNAKGAGGETALHVTVQRLLFRCTRLLLDNGADANATSELGTPLSLAESSAEMWEGHSNAELARQFKQMAELLRQHGAKE